jgi:hypothetical protein
MRFNLSFSSESKEVGPIIPTKVLNTDECGIAAVGVSFFGKLAYRPVGHGFAVTTGISHVYILQSTNHNQNRRARSVEADFDIYLTDGRVIEVHSFDRATIQAALAYAPVKDVRAKFRRMRGR